MSWNANTPRGDLLPVDERPRFQNNWNYIETEMQDDHFFDEDSDRDGHHKKVEMTNLTDAIGAGNVDANGDPNALSTDMTGMFYMRPKTSTEHSASQQTEPYFMMNDGANNIISQLGVKAMCYTQLSGASITNVSGNPWTYQHNISNVQLDNGIIKFVLFTFATPMTTSNYVVLATVEGDLNRASVLTRTTTNFSVAFNSFSGATGINVIVLGG